ncbi:hypothetical protein HAV15_001889 [Penicillium sp. str. |nr:hypothetical protein HAV15_001889 [Penicillium sp. str. \
MEEGTVPTPSEPPPLPYSLHTRKKSIAFFWTIFVVDTLAQPLILYWCLWYLTDLSPNLVFSIVTASLGGVSVFEYFYRLHNLFRKKIARPTPELPRIMAGFFPNQLHHRVVDFGRRTGRWIVRLIAMVLPTVMFYFGFVYLSLDIFRMMGFKAPFRISSTPKGSVMPTALYALIEDVVAVDGGGGQIYRYALRTRYLSSPYFRRMLFEMNCFWSGGSIICAAAITAVIFTVQENVAFTLGWTLPFVWAIIWTLITIPWVQSDLRREKKAWAENRGQGGIQWVDDISAPTARTRFASVQANIWPWTRDDQSPPSTPSVGAEKVPDVPSGVSNGAHDVSNDASSSAPHEASHVTDATYDGATLGSPNVEPPTEKLSV